MKTKYWLCKREEIFFSFDSASGKRESLHTSDKEEAKRIIRAKNDAATQPAINISVAHFNFCRVHASLKGQTPAMAAGLADHVWSIVKLLTYSGQVGSEKWFCPLHEPTVSPPIQILKAA